MSSTGSLRRALVALVAFAGVVVGTGAPAAAGPVATPKVLFVGDLLSQNIAEGFIANQDNVEAINGGTVSATAGVITPPNISAAEITVATPAVYQRALRTNARPLAGSVRSRLRLRRIFDN